MLPVTVDTDGQEETVKLLYKRPGYDSDDSFLYKLIGPTDDGGTVEVVFNDDGSILSITIDGEQVDLSENDRRMLNSFAAESDTYGGVTPRRELDSSATSEFCDDALDLLCTRGVGVLCSVLPNPALGLVCRLTRLGICLNKDMFKRKCKDFAGCEADPHITGFKGQKFMFTGEDDAWFALLHDDNTSINMRITALDAHVSYKTHITGLGASLMGSDGKLHTVMAAVKNPHAPDETTSCSDRLAGPCLAEGALQLTLDGEDMVLPGKVSLEVTNHICLPRLAFF